MANNNPLISKYLTRPIVRQRNSVTLAAWSAYETAAAIPDVPDDAWVRMRVQAEAVPLALDFHTTQTLCYFVQDPVTVQNIVQFISEDNDDTIELDLSDKNSSIVSAFAQRWADSVVTAQQVADWRTRNNKPATGKDKP